MNKKTKKPNKLEWKRTQAQIDEKRSPETEEAVKQSMLDFPGLTREEALEMMLAL
jgi:DNA-nicking Smr family endonuclease